MGKKCFLGVLFSIVITLSCVSAAAAVLYGDLNSDGKVDSTDFLLMRSVILGNYELSNTAVADLNGDGVVNTTDYALLKSYLMGAITQFPVESTVIDEDAWKNNTGTINLGTSITYTGTGISTSGSVVRITAGGDHSVTGTLSNGMIYIDTTEKVKLRLSGVNITNSSGPAIYFANADKAFITLTENTTNYLTDGTAYSDAEAKGALFSNDTLEIKGKGTLYVTGKYKHGIVSDDDIIIENGNIIVQKAVKDGIHANDNITVTGGTLNVTATSDGIQSEGDLIIDGGSITVSAGDDGIACELDLTINGGQIKVLKSYEGIESKANLIVNGGELNIIASDDGLNAAKSLTINGGDLYLAAGADALDSNGRMDINGGYTVAYAGNNPEGAADCDNNIFTIKGGTLIGMGGRNSTPTTSTSTQCSVMLGSATANSVIRIVQGSDEILNFTATKAYQTMLFTSPKLALNTSYTVYINGVQSTSFTTSSVFTNAGGGTTGQNPGGPRW